MARAMWKGVISFSGIRLPVKLYAAVEDRTIRFRLLHAIDRVPVKQRMVNPLTGSIVEHGKARRGLEVERDRFVLLRDQELEALEPQPSRNIAVTRFIDPQAVNHQWYDRPYYLGPDGNPADYYAFARALEQRGREGIAHWVMRKKRYLGALRAESGHLMLMTLRHAEEVIPPEDLEAPSGRPLEARERDMGERFINALVEAFEPSRYHDEYRERVMQLIELKRRGGTVETAPVVEKHASDDLLQLLEASIESVS